MRKTPSACRYALLIALSATLLATLTPSRLGADEPAAKSPGAVVVLQGAKVYDGAGGLPLENADVFIEGPRITYFGASGEQPAPDGAKVIDCRGKIIIPGLIAAHAHIGQVDGLENGAANYNRENILRQLRQYQRYGVTTIASLGLNGPLFYQLRDSLHRGELPGADMLGADRGLGVAGGAPPAAALNIAGNQLDRPQTPAEARTAVQAAKTRGADLTKLWCDDFRGSLPVKMSPEIYSAAIDEAHRQGLRVAAHVYYLEDAKALARAGVDILAHGVRDLPVDVELIDLLKSRSVWYIPTISVDDSAYIYADRPAWMDEPFFTQSLQPPLQAQFASAAWREDVLANPKLVASREAVKQNQRNLAALHDAGVNIAFGADSGATPLRIPGFSEHRELALMCEAGLSPLETLTAATGNSARVLGLDDRGVLAAGKRADLVVLNADPAEAIANTQQIYAVWHRGVIVDSGK